MESNFNTVGIPQHRNLIVIAVCFLCCFLRSAHTEAQNLTIKNGYVWQGDGFKNTDLYVINGKFSKQDVQNPDTVIDAAGKYIVPPFGDYHTHSFYQDWSRVRNTDSSYIAKGMFYSQDLLNDPVGRRRNRQYLDKKETVDVSFANGALVSDFGHPIEGLERMALGMGWPRNEAEREKIRNSRILQDRYYYIISDTIDTRLALHKLIATQPDVIKVILFNSEIYKISTDSAVLAANKGINPVLLDEVMKVAREYNIRVVAHIESEYDLKIALQKGIREFAHAPNYGYGNDGQVSIDYPRLSNETKILLKKHNPVINPTLYRTFLNIKYLPADRRLDSAERSIIRSFHKDLLQDLVENGAELAMGADSPGLDAIDEVFYYKKLKAFADRELIKMLIGTGNLIFPDRSIGEIKPGYEASFLMLSGNPSEDIVNIENIEATIKQGIILK